MRNTTLSMRSSRTRPTAPYPRNPGEYSMRALPKHWSGGSPSVSHREPELLAYHYEQAGLAGPAVEYWHRAARRDAERSANIEALNHFNRALELLKELPQGAERNALELELLLARGAPLLSVKGYASDEMEHNYRRAKDLLQEHSESSASVSRHSGIMGISSGQRAPRQCARPSRKSPRAGSPRATLGSTD